MTLKQLLNNTSAYEIAEWKAYYQAMEEMKKEKPQKDIQRNMLEFFKDRMA